MIDRLSFPSILRHLINKPPRWLVCRLSMASGELSEKNNIWPRSEGFEETYEILRTIQKSRTLSASIQASRKAVYLFSNPPVIFHIARKPLLKKIVQSDSGFIFVPMQILISPTPDSIKRVCFYSMENGRDGRDENTKPLCCLPLVAFVPFR